MIGELGMRRTWNVHDRLLYIIEGRRKEKYFRDNSNIATAYEKKSYVKNNIAVYHNRRTI